MELLSLNENPEISSLHPLTYSRLLNNIDQSKEKNIKSQYTFLNLKKLVQNFKLDINEKLNYIKKPPRPAFVSKSYYQNNPEFSYNYPPKGPIPLYFECIYCEQEGPQFHLEDCKKPFESSLYLTEAGEKKYSKPVGTSYKLIVKKRGQKKIISTSVKNQRFSDNVELVYENENETHTIVKIGKNGVINIISANFENKSIISDILKKINETGAINESEYHSDVFKIDKDTTYTYIILAQFNLYPKEHTLFYINLNAINLNLWDTPLFKQKINGKTYFKIGSKKYQIENYRYNSGNIISKSNKQTNPFIQFDIILQHFKVGVLIYKKGAVQMRLSYLDKKFEQKIDHPLTLDTLSEVYLFLKQLFKILIQNSSETEYPIIVNEIVPEKKGIRNMVDGKQPLVCQNHKGYELRPVPYSFYGKCPMDNYYVRPEGKKRPDGKFEPCCYKIKKTGQDSIETINNNFINGYKSIEDPDTHSAVFTPGTKIVESRRFKGLNDLTQTQLLDSMEQLNYIGKQSKFKKNKEIELIFEHLSYINKKDNLKNVLMTPIPIDTIRVILSFNENGISTFINTLQQTSESGLSKIKELSGTIMDGYLDTEEEVFYPFDIPFFKGEDICKKIFKYRFDTLMYCLEIINNAPGTLTLSTNFDDSIENILDEENTFILFIPLNSIYTIGKINKSVRIWTPLIDNNYTISLNVNHLKKNRWKVSINSKSINSIILPQKEDSIEIPVIFINKNKIEDNDIILFKINLNTNGIINNNKPLLPIEKLSSHINDYSDIINILEYIHSNITKQELTNFG